MHRHITYTSHLGTAATDAYSLQKYNNLFNSLVQFMCTPRKDGLKILQFYEYFAITVLARDINLNNMEFRYWLRYANSYTYV